ncbi:hypothetical protein EST38_g13482 [Candolleomyces aberdarensis]|uniref:Uncharacterized protein n=1 Tax=Candolleomyces aberdarensis TaxID=2316362 RepID=A0A4Q2D0W0_9AGAR|nr:hypothetical protein EST38_g13482 [Candolleomyces aberdarensis]
MSIEIVDSISSKNIYLSKKGIKGETRLAITTHADDMSSDQASKLTRIADLHVDTGADDVDYNADANRESLSGLETEMRKIKGS